MLYKKVKADINNYHIILIFFTESKNCQNKKTYFTLYYIL